MGAVASAQSATSYSTASYQPAPGALLIAMVVNSKASAPDTPTFSGNGLTWEQIDTVTYNTVANPTQRMTTFRAQGTSPSSDAGTASFGEAAQMGCIIHVMQIQGADATGANGANAIVQHLTNVADRTEDPGLAYAPTSAPGTNMLVFAFADSVDSIDDATPQLHWTGMQELSYDTPATGLTVDYQANAMACETNVANAASTRNWASMLLEIRPDTVAVAPVLVQALGTASNENNTGNTFKFHMPNLTLGGNTLIAALTYHHGASRTVAITDDRGDTWTAGPAIASVGSGMDNDVATSVHYATNIAANVSEIQVAFDGDIPNVQVNIFEFRNIVACEPASGYSLNGASGSPTITSGCFTPTADGAMVFMHAVDVRSGTLGFPQNWTAGPMTSGLKFLMTDQKYSIISAFGVQKTAAPVNPTITTMQASGDPYLSIGMAFKVAAQGTAPGRGIRIVSMYHTVPPATSTVRMWLPCEGNLLVVDTSYPNDTDHISGAIDSLSNTYSKAITSIEKAPQMFFTDAGAITRRDPPVEIALFTSGTGPMLFAYDIAGAASSGAFDTVAEATGTQTLPDEDIVDAPVIVPSSGNGLVIGVTAFGTGPAYATIGTGFILDGPNYLGQTDSSPMTAGDGYQHIFNRDCAPLAFGWHMRNGTISGWNALAAAFKSGTPVISIVPGAPGFATLSWTPSAPGFHLQVNETLTPTGWADAPSGTNNPATVSVGSPSAVFYRLVRP